MRFLFYFVDKAVHGMGNLWKVYAKPLTIECCRHRLIVLGSDIDNARDKADVTIITDTIYRRNKLIVKVLCILVVFAILVAQILLAVYEGHDNCVFEVDVECVGVFIASSRARPQVIPE